MRSDSRSGYFDFVAFFNNLKMSAFADMQHELQHE